MINLQWFAVGILIFIMILAALFLIQNNIIDKAKPGAKIEVYRFSFLAFAFPGNIMKNIFRHRKKNKGFFFGLDFIKILIFIVITLTVALALLGLIDVKSVSGSLSELKSTLKLW